MRIEPLPAQVVRLLGSLEASPRLRAHLLLVHATARQLLTALDQHWPTLMYDRQAVLLGAALHDIGKVVHPQELTNPGHQHERAGERLLQQQGIAPELARFARTHAQWSADPGIRLEDVLVAWADTLWRGRRDGALEGRITSQIVRQTNEPEWQMFAILDDIATEITALADERLAWQQRYPV